MLTAMRSYACWTSNKTNHMNAPAYVSVLGTLCKTHIYIYIYIWANSCTCQYIIFFPGKVLMNIPCRDTFEEQPQFPITTRKESLDTNTDFRPNYLLNMSYSPGVTNQAELVQARYYWQVIHFLRCDAMYSGRKVPRLVSTFSYTFRVAYSSNPKDCRNRPTRNAAVFCKQNTRQKIPEDSIIFSSARIHTHTHMLLFYVLLFGHSSTRLFGIVPFTVGTEPRDWKAGVRIAD